MNREQYQHCRATILAIIDRYAAVCDLDAYDRRQELLSIGIDEATRLLPKWRAYYDGTLADYIAQPVAMRIAKALPKLRSPVSVPEGRARADREAFGELYGYAELDDQAETDETPEDIDWQSRLEAALEEIAESDESVEMLLEVEVDREGRAESAERHGRTWQRAAKERAAAMEKLRGNPKLRALLDERMGREVVACEATTPAPEVRVPAPAFRLAPFWIVIAPPAHRPWRSLIASERTVSPPTTPAGTPTSRATMVGNSQSTTTRWSSTSATALRFPGLPSSWVDMGGTFLVGVGVRKARPGGATPPSPGIRGVGEEGACPHSSAGRAGPGCVGLVRASRANGGRCPRQPTRILFSLADYVGLRGPPAPLQLAA